MRPEAGGGRWKKKVHGTHHAGQIDHCTARSREIDFPSRSMPEARSIFEMAAGVNH